MKSRKAYVGIAFVFLFAAFASWFLLSFPDIRFHRDVVKELKNVKIQRHEVVSTPDIDSAVVCAIFALSVSESTIGLSFDEYRVVRESQDRSRYFEKAFISSGWDFLSRGLGGMFMPISNREYSALVPYLAYQIKKGYITPALFVVEGGQESLRRAWEIIGNSFAANVNIPYLEFLW